MVQQKAKFSWHYYVMALGALMALMAITLGAWGAAISGVGLAIMSLPALQLKLPARLFFIILFGVFYYLAFPSPAVVKTMMQSSDNASQSSLKPNLASNLASKVK